MIATTRSDHAPGDGSLYAVTEKYTLSPLITADAVAPGGLDGADEVVRVGVVAAPAAIAAERCVHRDELRPAGFGKQVAVEGHAQVAASIR